MASTTASLSQNIELVISDLRDKFQRCPRKRRDTVFYWVVRGGNYDLAASALTVMKQTKMQAELDWLLHPEEGSTRKRDSVVIWLKKVFCFLAKMLVLAVICFLALTPVFPIFYAVFSEVFSKRKDCSRSCDLPLYLATLSRQARIVELFRDQGVCVGDQEDGNNVFHVLVDNSVTNSDAKSLYQLIVETYRGAGPEVQHALLRQTNNHGLTPFESCIKYGSPHLLNAMIDTEGLLQATIVSIGTTSFRVDKAARNQTGGNTAQLSFSEAAELRQHVATANPRERLKTQIFLPDATGTTYQRVRYEVTDFESGGSFHRQSLPLLLLSNRDLETMTRESLKALHNNQLLVEWTFLKRRAMHSILVAHCIFRLALTICAACYALLVSINYALLPSVAQFAKEYEKISSLSTELSFVLNDSYKLAGLLNKSNLAVDEHSLNLAEKCFKPVNEQNETAEETRLDACWGLALQQVQEKCTDLDLMTMVQDHTSKDISDLWVIEGSSKFTLNVLTIVAAVHISSHIFTRFVLICKNLRWYGLDTGIRRLFATGLPGSKADEILMAASSCSAIVLQIITLRMNATKTLTTELISDINAINLLYSGYILCVVLSWLWSLRLLPRIGYFIFITGKLVRCLGQFFIVFGFVFIVMSSLFYYVMRDEDCELKSHPQFSTLWDTMYETYKVLFGHGEFWFDANTTSKLLYLVYSVYCVLLILNFIIAIMSSTADYLMTEPWKGCIWEREYLSEYLSYEPFLNALLFLFRLHSWFLQLVGYEVFGEDTKYNSCNCMPKQVFIETERTVRGDTVFSTSRA